MVKASDAMMGVAFDGDADRCLAVDEDGNMVNGDQIMGILARAKKAEGKLAHDTLVVTVMSNLGLKLALKDMGIATVQTAVGDRYVLEEMLRGGYTLGGEQSGHVINREFATTGDGTLTALTLCNEVMKSGKSLKQLARHPAAGRRGLRPPGAGRGRRAGPVTAAEADNGRQREQRKEPPPCSKPTRRSTWPSTVTSST